MRRGPESHAVSVSLPAGAPVSRVRSPLAERRLSVHQPGSRRSRKLKGVDQRGPHLGLLIENGADLEPDVVGQIQREIEAVQIHRRELVVVQLPHPFAHGLNQRLAVIEVVLVIVHPVPEVLVHNREGESPVEHCVAFGHHLQSL